MIGLQRIKASGNFGRITAAITITVHHQRIETQLKILQVGKPLADRISKGLCGIERVEFVLQLPGVRYSRMAVIR